MTKIAKSRKIEAIEKMYRIWMAEYLGYDEIQVRIRQLMAEEGITFLAPTDIDEKFTLLDISDIEGCFFEWLNSPKYTDPAYFAILCESFMDFEPLIRLDHIDTYNLNPERSYCVGIIAGDLNTLINGSKPKAA